MGYNLANPDGENKQNYTLRDTTQRPQMENKKEYWYIKTFDTTRH